MSYSDLPNIPQYHTSRYEPIFNKNRNRSSRNAVLSRPTSIARSSSPESDDSIPSPNSHLHDEDAARSFERLRALQKHVRSRALGTTRTVGGIYGTQHASKDWAALSSTARRGPYPHGIDQSLQFNYKAVGRNARLASPKLFNGNDTPNTLRRATTEPYPSLVSSAAQMPRRGDRFSPYREHPNGKFGVDQTSNLDRTLRASGNRSSYSPMRAYLATFPTTPTQEPLPLGPPRQRIPPSDPVGHAPFDPRSGGYDTATSLEYYEFEYQEEPFLDVPIPFEGALPKGFEPLSPLF